MEQKAVCPAPLHEAAACPTVYRQIQPTKEMKKIYTILTLGLAMLTSCEKEIDIDYHTVEPLYVVEANISDNGAVAKITQTLDVPDTLWNKNVENAEVTITGEDGSLFTLNHDSAGIYSAPEACGVPGKKYTLRVKIGDYVTESTSEMQEPFNVSDYYIYKIVMMSDDVYCVRVDVEDDGTTPSYYYTLITRKGKPYKWLITDNRGQYGTTEIDLGCFIDSDMENDKDDILQDGEELDVEVRKVDQKTYDYYWSLAIGMDNHANPLRQFSNNTLGYFSACSIKKLPALTYKKEEVKYLKDYKSN